MATTRNIMFCSLVSQALLLLSVTDAGPVVTVDPAEIIPGFTETLVVNCSFSLDGTPNMVDIIALIVSRSNSSAGDNDKLLAEMTNIRSASENKHTEGFTIEGLINQEGDTYITLRWEHPSEHQAGVYTCSAEGFDQSGHSIVEQDMAEVGSIHAGYNEMTYKLIELEVLMQQKLSDMDEVIRRLEQNVSSLLAARDNIFSNMFQDPSWTYQDRKYHLSRYDFHNVDFAIAMCILYGGNLVEISDADEYQALQAFLANASSDFTDVLVAGTDDLKEGNWVLQSTRQPLPFADWLPGQPNGNRSENCLFLANGNPWRMADYKCNDNPAEHTLSHYIPFMCEMPLT